VRAAAAAIARLVLEGMHAKTVRSVGHTLLCRSRTRLMMWSNNNLTTLNGLVAGRGLLPRVAVEVGINEC
jgi:hypothetical protein